MEKGKAIKKKQYKSAKWYEWANNVWDKKGEEILKKSVKDKIRIIFYTYSKKHKKDKEKWFKEVETKMAELEIKIKEQGLEEEKKEIIENFQALLIKKLDELVDKRIEEWLEYDKNNMTKIFIGGKNGKIYLWEKKKYRWVFGRFV